jgi:hypothetical protein
LLFKNTNTTKEDLIGLGGQIGLDTQKFSDELDRGDYVTIIDDDTEFAEKAGVRSTPAFFLNGQKMEFESTLDFKDQVEAKIKENIPQVIYKPTTTTVTSEPENVEEQHLEERLSPKELEASKKTLEISFTPSGWNPQNTMGYPGQLVKWTNQTAQNIKLVQLYPKFPELNGGVEIAPGSSFEFRLYNYGLWRYIDEYTEKWAEISIKR